MIYRYEFCHPSNRSQKTIVFATSQLEAKMILFDLTGSLVYPLVGIEKTLYDTIDEASTAEQYRLRARTLLDEAAPTIDDWLAEHGYAEGASDFDVVDTIAGLLAADPDPSYDAFDVALAAIDEIAQYLYDAASDRWYGRSENV